DEYGAGTDPAFDPKRSSERLHDAARDREPETTALASIPFAVSDLEELAEDRTEMLRRDARTRVTYPHLDAAPGSSGNFDLHQAMVGEFHGVADEIRQGAGELAPVRADSDRLCRPLKPQAQAFLTRRRGAGRETFLDEVGKRELIVAQFLLAGIEAADLEQIREQVCERLRRGLKAVASFQKAPAVADPLLRFLPDQGREQRD